MKIQKEKSRNQSHSPLQQKFKKKKNLRISLPKETKKLYTENYKALLKGVKEVKESIHRNEFHVPE